MGLMAKPSIGCRHFAISPIISDYLAPGLGKTKTGRLWTYVRDERLHQGSHPPAAVYSYSPDRKAEHPQDHLKDFTGVLHADGYAGLNVLFDGGRVRPRVGRMSGASSLMFMPPTARPSPKRRSSASAPSMASKRSSGASYP
jgi:hypothetical protein